MKPVNSARPESVFGYIYANSLVSDNVCNCTTITGKYKNSWFGVSAEMVKSLLDIFFPGMRT